MRPSHLLMRALVAFAVLAVMVGACGKPSGTAFTTTIRTADGDLALQVSLYDATGLVTAIDPAQVDSSQFRDAGVLVDPADPNAFILTWLGGMCDNDVELALASSGPSYDVRVAIHVKFGSCPGAGVFRAVRIATSKPLPIEAMTISGSKSIQFVRDDDCGPLTGAETNDAKVACGVLITATVGDDPARFARVTVRPEDGACPGTECSTNAGIEAQPWRVNATDRAGGEFAWRCTYRSEMATCVVITQQSPS